MAVHRQILVSSFPRVDVNFSSRSVCLNQDYCSNKKVYISLPTRLPYLFGSVHNLETLGSLQIRQLDETAHRLMQTHPEAAENILQKQSEINEEWTQLQAKANARKEKLLDSYDLQRFLSDFRDLMNWIQSMKVLVSSEELADDVTGAEALLERHQVRIFASLFTFLSMPLEAFRDFMVLKLDDRFNWNCFGTCTGASYRD